MSPKKILIVEDEATLRHALRDKLDQEGFNVLEAANGQEGLAMALEQEPNLILLDIIMPVMDGLTMARRLRQEELSIGKLANNHIPIILLTNLSGVENMAEAQKHGIYSYLVKTDWKIENVVKKIKDTLGV